MGAVLSVNVGPIAPYAVGTGNRSAIVKAPVEGRVTVRGVNLDGDDQADRRVHGGPEQAVYAYARESYEWWEGELGRPLEPGTFGENLTLTGVDVDGALIGERWEIGTTVLEITAPRIPCVKLAARIGDPQFVKRFAQARRPGAYLRIVQEGDLSAGDEVRIAVRPEHDVTIALVNEALLHDHSLAERILVAPQLHARARTWALDQSAA